jgi:hypothetical protein
VPACLFESADNSSGTVKNAMQNHRKHWAGSSRECDVTPLLETFFVKKSASAGTKRLTSLVAEMMGPASLRT